ncbi:ABC-2 type transport system permease protein [Actinoalloteichus hymeniacidonis]|nr:ABC-2 type transport system permease protein [Actinoalloteichus hymeniacidonis]
MFIIPVAMAGFFIYQHELFESLGGGLGAIAAIMIFYVAGLGLYTTAVTTLASRRQNLFLKRLRSTAASDSTILFGLMLPVVVISVLQSVVILGVLGVVAGAPGDILMLVLAVLSLFVMMVGLALATAGITNSPEHAQVTTLPIGVGTVALASWIGFAGGGDLQILQRVLPGGSAAELIVESWNGGISLSDSLPLLIPTAAWIVVSVVLAIRYFRWEPRR